MQPGAFPRSVHPMMSEGEMEPTGSTSTDRPASMTRPMIILACCIQYSDRLAVGCRTQRIGFCNATGVSSVLSIVLTG